MDVHPIKNCIFIGIDPYPNQLLVEWPRLSRMPCHGFPHPLKGRQDPNEVRQRPVTTATKPWTRNALLPDWCWLYDRSNLSSWRWESSCRRFCWLIFPKNLFGSRHCFSRTGCVVFERFIPRPVGAAKCAREANILKFSKHSCLTDFGQTSKLLEPVSVS